MQVVIYYYLAAILIDDAFIISDSIEIKKYY